MPLEGAALASPLVLPDVAELPAVPELPEVASGAFLALAFFFLVFFAFGFSVAVSVPAAAAGVSAEVPEVPEVAGAREVSPVVLPLVADAPDEEVPLVPLLPEDVSGAFAAPLAGPPLPVIPLSPVAFWEGIVVGEDAALPVPDGMSLAPDAPDEVVPLAPLLPDEVSGALAAPLAGPPLPVIPLSPVAF